MMIVFSMLVFLVVIVYVLMLVYVINFFVWIIGDFDWLIFERIYEDINLGLDWLFGEIVNYGVVFFVLVLFLFVFIENCLIMFLFFFILMLFVWFDDVVSYYERFGKFLFEMIDLLILLCLKLYDIGEVFVWVLVGLFFFLLFFLVLFKCCFGDFGVFVIVLFGFGLFVVCGVLVDFIYVVVLLLFGLIFLIVEDGGEMLVIVWIVGVVLCLICNGWKYYKVL